MQLWRQAWRLRRATVASAVLVIQDCRDRVLVLSSPQSVRLPSIELRAGDAVATQVDEHLRGLSQTCTASLVAVDGGPSPEGVRFLYIATYDGDTSQTGGVWLETHVALECLIEADCQLLRSCMSHRRDVVSNA